MADLLSAWRAEIIQAAARSRAYDARPAARQGTARRALRQLAMAAAAVAVTAGLVAGTCTATPESPLWPVTTASPDLVPHPLPNRAHPPDLTLRPGQLRHHRRPPATALGRRPHPAGDEQLWRGRSPRVGDLRL
ncbi:MAG TPA: hypothetical protein VFB84_16645 [Micromonosporaceae bacterium]|nr:hypothetical protein [Micromonosporaceae bacterium]